MGLLKWSCLIATLLAAAPAGAQSTVIPDVELKLFETSEVDLTKGCSVAMWQEDRNPGQDKFAYVFVEMLTGKNHARQPARMKIGGQVVPLTRIAVGGKTNGYGLHEYQLYKLPGENDYVIQNLKLEEEMGEAVGIESGKISVVMNGRQIFRISVKGGAGCSTPPAPDVPAAKPVTVTKTVADTAPRPGMFERYVPRPQQVHPAVLAAAAKTYACKNEVMKTGIVGFQLSEESAIWQIPCDRYAYQSTSVFALVYLPDPSLNLSFIKIPGPPKVERTSGLNLLMDPEWDIKTRTVRSVSKGRGLGDCGVFEKYRVTPEGGFALMAYREKEKCDGKVSSPDTWPVIFPKT